MRYTVEFAQSIEANSPEDAVRKILMNLRSETRTTELWFEVYREDRVSLELVRELITGRCELVRGED